MKELKDWLSKELEMQKQTVVFGSNKIYIEGRISQTKDILKKISELEAKIIGEVAVLPKKICDKCGGKIRRTYASACPTNGVWYCEKCIDPDGKIYNDAFFGKTDAR